MESTSKRFNAHLPNNAAAIFNVLDSQLMGTVQGRYFALCKFFLQEFFVDFCVNGGNFRIPTNFFANFTHSPECALNVFLASSGRCTASYEGNPCFTNFWQNNTQISLDSFIIAVAFASTEVIGPGVHGSAIDAHQIRLAFHSPVKTLGRESIS